MSVIEAPYLTIKNSYSTNDWLLALYQSVDIGAWIYGNPYQNSEFIIVLVHVWNLWKNVVMLCSFGYLIL